MRTYSISDFTDTILLSHHSELYSLIRRLFKMRSTLEDNFNALWCDHLEKLKLAEEKHGLDDVRFKFSVPRIVAIGEESSGKSSTLERIAMLKIFPSDRRLCTRMPIELRLRYVDKTKLPEQFRETGFVEMNLLRSENSRIPEEPASPYMHPNEVEDKVRQWMETVVYLNNDTVTGVTNDRLLIKLFSSRKLNLDLIDLPGIVAGSIRDEPSDMMDRTRNIAGSYLDDLNNPHTFVIAVVSATETRIRNSQAMELVQRYNKANMTIGVLTMADLAGDPRSDSNPYEILKGRLDGNADDLPSIDLGYFALKNRDTSVTENMLDLVEVNEEEKRWFEQNLPDHTNQCGIDSLVAQLVHMLEKYTLKKWVRAERERLLTLREEVSSELLNLGNFFPSKEGVIDMLNALTEAFSNVEITEAQEMSDEAPAQQDIQTTTPLTAVQEDDIKQESRRVLFRIGRNRRTNSFGFAKLEEELNKKRRNMHHQRTPCPECPKSGGPEACLKCSPLNFCFLPAHGNSSDGTISKAMCPKCTPDNFCRDTGHGNTEESPAHKSSCVKCSPKYFGCMEDPKAFRNPGNTRA